MDFDVLDDNVSTLPVFSLYIDECFDASMCFYLYYQLLGDQGLSAAERFPQESHSKERSPQER